MKKLFIALFILFASSFCFAKPFEGSEKLIEDFLQKGTYVKVITNKSIIYYYKINIISVEAYEKNLELRTIVEVESYYGRDTNEPEYNIERFNISSDSNGNIVISKKED